MRPQESGHANVPSRVLGCIHAFAALAALLLGSALHAQCGASWLPAAGGDPISAPRCIVNTTRKRGPDGQGPQSTNFVVAGRFAVADSTSCNVARHDGSCWTALPPLMPAGMEKNVAPASRNNQLIAVTPARVARFDLPGTWTTIGVRF